MHTIRHIEDGTGKETMIEAAVVEFNKEENCLIGWGPAPAFAELKRWHSGHAYVMNENGKTVAVYNITMKLK